MGVISEVKSSVRSDVSLTKNSTNGASFVDCRSVEPAMTAIASAMEGSDGSSAGIFGTS